MRVPVGEIRKQVSKLPEEGTVDQHYVEAAGGRNYLYVKATIFLFPNPFSDLISKQGITDRNDSLEAANHQPSFTSDHKVHCVYCECSVRYHVSRESLGLHHQSSLWFLISLRFTFN
jgi:hypothetical protein